MSGISLSARRSAPGRQRLRLPATRGGLAWLLVLAIIGTFLAVQFGRQIYANWEISRQADSVREQIAAVEAQNDALRQKLRYLRSNAYISAEARRLTDLGVAGEQVLIIPEGAEEPLPAELGPSPAPPRPLFEQWLDLFFGP